MTKIPNEFNVSAFELEMDFASVAERAGKTGEIMDNLPGIFVSFPINDEGVPAGRNIFDYYSTETSDPDGRKALSYGSDYYQEAMSYQDPKDHALRIECFKAAEILYLHSYRHGNIIACMCLGYNYSYDRCEGDYWQKAVLWMSEDWAASEEKLEEYFKLEANFPLETHAYESFLWAAQNNEPEACYKIGDMLKEGIGCEVNYVTAFEWYKKPYDLGASHYPTVWGSAAY